ncbi:KN motif and ankyrin repeat domain-containing protein 4-like isoform X2 [Myxocyprinus asiaticus]|uniref:KN motif and ankyrin repeat domain-containing protein 4-like isoform X2 n=1 Tax=Myxocyprinus asiaticus TaxID=70543 RepID=UPI002221F9BE|nr:KN motif and ankyrin repeat domain-containing protein 4-like isoform X2 [Myxocyprinus asiaticus]
MDTPKVNGISIKENGSKRRPPSYSVETPYGFHLDLDFLKYVDDIEKGNTIRRVPVQRRQRGRNNGILSRNLSLPGYGCRATQWNSISTLWPKTQLVDSQHFEFRSSDSMSASYARTTEPIYKSFTATEIDASIQAFDEQPLGHYIRPNLLRASSLPLTVFLRKQSESTEDPTSPSSPKEYLEQENGSSEDVFHASNRTGRANGTLQRLTAALERVGELEMEIRVIPELKAQICILQEERERLLLQLHSQNDTTGPLDVPRHTNKLDIPLCALKTKENQDKAIDDWMNREYDRLEENVKASSEQVDAFAIPSTSERMLQDIGCSLQLRKTVLRDRDLLDNVDRTKSLTETLQRKVVMLEKKIHDLEVELDKTKALLKHQVDESHLKDEEIKQLSAHPDTGHTFAKTTSSGITSTSTQNLQPVVESREGLICVQEMAVEEGITLDILEQPPVSQTDIEQHVKKLQELLQEQWKCLCKEDSNGRISSEHLPPRVCTIQDQLVTLVTLLTLYVFPTGDIPQPAKMEERIPVVEEENPKTESLKTVSLRDSENAVKDGISNAIKLHEHIEEDADIKKNTKIEADKSWTPWTMDPKVPTGKSEDAESNTKEDVIDEGTTKKEEMHKETSHASDPEDQTGREEVAFNQKQLEQSKGNREAVNKDFIEACCFLKDHMDKMSEPDNSQALTVVFQQWFHVSAEEDARADIVSLYINEVKSQTPTVLEFLVNMVDDNGNTALHYSVSHSNFSIVKLLLDTGVCEVDRRNKSGYTAIMLASLTDVESPGDMKVLQQLMELGDVNAHVGQVGQTALHLAVRHGRVPIVRLLLAQGADPNAQDHAGTTPMISACDRGHINVVRILLEDTNCDVNLKDKGGRSALSLATQASHTEIADLLKARTETKSSEKCKVS